MRTLAPLAALGAGLVHIAVAASAPVVLAGLLAAFGAAELLWSILCLRAGRLVMPRVALYVSVGSSIAWAAMGFALVNGGVTSASLAVPMLPFVAATVFSLTVAIGCGVLLRRTGASGRISDRGSDSTERPARAGWRELVGIAAAALAVAAIATPALASTDAGSHASHDHSSHEIVFDLPTGHEH